jgi:hypothetical protein
MPVTSTPIETTEQWLDLRKKNVGCSELGALFGVHDFLTGYGLAARKLGLLDDTVDNEVLERGRMLEPIARQLLAKQQPDWAQIIPSSYYHDDDIHFGATPDLFVRNDRGVGVVQIKTVAPAVFASKWHTDNGIEPPLWIALQAMGEQHLTGAEFAYVAALVVGYGLSLELVEVPYLSGVIAEARVRVRNFWEMIDTGKLPEPDFAADRGNLSAVLRQDDGTEIDLTADNELPAIAASLAAAQTAKHVAENVIDHCQAKILHKIGTAQRATFAGGLITAKTVNRKGYVAKPSSYRRLNVKRDQVEVAQ